jgi:hypothetical protein
MSSVYAGEVLWNLISNDLGLPRDYSIEGIRHDVSDLNWRQIHATPRAQALALAESLIHEGPFEGTLISVGSAEEFLGALHKRPARPGATQSITSRIWGANNEPVGHLALMNLHPEGFNDLDELVRAIHGVTNYLPGYLLGSGRYFHYYGQALLSEQEWLQFVAQFLMPCNIGHSLNRGFCSLRLTAVPSKPKTPELICKI